MVRVALFQRNLHITKLRVYAESQELLQQIYHPTIQATHFNEILIWMPMIYVSIGGIIGVFLVVNSVFIVLIVAGSWFKSLFAVFAPEITGSVHWR